MDNYTFEKHKLGQRNSSVDKMVIFKGKNLAYGEKKEKAAGLEHIYADAH